MRDTCRIVEIGVLDVQEWVRDMIKRNALYVGLFLLTASIVWWSAAKVDLPDDEINETSTSHEAIKNDASASKDEESAKNDSISSSNISRTSKLPPKEKKSPLARLANSKLNETAKVSLIREHILNSDYRINELIDELNDASELLSKDSLQELVFLSLQHCAEKFPFETKELVEKIDLSPFFTVFDEDSDKLVLEAVYTGFLKSGDAEILQEVKDSAAYSGLKITDVLQNLGSDNAMSWAVKNRSFLTDDEFDDIASIDLDDYKSLAIDKIYSNYNYAINWAKSFKKGSLEEAYAYSNIAIRQYMNESLHSQPKNWVNDIESEFARDRTTLGFALGASRFYKDDNLERSLKRMFRKNNFKKDEALTLIQDSTLPSDVKEELVRLNNS